MRRRFWIAAFAAGLFTAAVIPSFPVDAAETTGSGERPLADRFHRDRATLVVLDREAQHRSRGEDAHVERIHVGLHGAAEEAGKRLFVTHLVEPGEQGFERGEPLRLDRGLVEVGGAEVRHLTGQRAGRRCSRAF